MKKLIAICILSFVAFINATYLTYENYRIEKLEVNSQVSSFCDINNILSCTNVLSSPYSKVFWLPFPAIAMIVYPLIFAIAYLWAEWLMASSFKYLLILWISWAAFNWYFIAQEFLHIWSYCPLCLMCSVIIITIAIISYFWIRDCKAEARGKIKQV